MIECEPCVNDEVLNEATPFESATVASNVVPSENFTLPVAVEGVTVAVRVTELPTTAGFADEITVMEDAAWTVSVRMADVDDVSLESPA